MKSCKHCKQVKPDAMFSPNRLTMCIKCHLEKNKATSKAYYERNKEKAISTATASYIVKKQQERADNLPYLPYLLIRTFKSKGIVNLQEMYERTHYQKRFILSAIRKINYNIQRHDCLVYIGYGKTKEDNIYIFSPINFKKGYFNEFS